MIVCRRKVLLIHHKTFVCYVNKNQAETQPIKEIAGILTRYRWVCWHTKLKALRKSLAQEKRTFHHGPWREHVLCFTCY